MNYCKIFYRNASTEVSVLIDILNITREKHYMILDPIPLDQTETKPVAQVYSRKKVFTTYSIVEYFVRLLIVLQTFDYL